MAGSELSNQVFQAGQAPDYLGHYAELLKSIPNAGLQFLAAAKADAERATQLQQYEILKQKAKAFSDMYPAFKAAQIAKLQAEAATLPYRQALLQEQAGLANARAASLRPPPDGTVSPAASVVVPAPPSAIGTPGAPLDVFKPNGVLADQGAPAAPAPTAGPGLSLGATAPPDPFAVAPLDQ